MLADLLAMIDVTDYFTAADIARADAYHASRDPLVVADIALELVVVAVLGLGAGARRLAAWSDRLPRGRWVPRALVLVAVLTVTPWAVSLPLTLARHRLDHRYDLATNSVPSLLRDAAVGIGFTVATSALAAVGTIWLARRARRWWPAALGVAGSAFIALGVFVAPLLYEPALNRFTPASGATRQMVLSLATDAGVEVGDVLVADASRRTNRRNAYVSGLGASRRVVLYDTLLAESDARDVRLVVAHELAHEAHADVRNGTLLGIGGFWLAVGLVWLLLRTARGRVVAGARDPSDPAMLPFLAVFLFVATLVTLPASNAISRRVEARADRTAIELTDDAEGAVQLEVNLARDHLSDVTPNRAMVLMFATHPTPTERIEAALEHR